MPITQVLFLAAGPSLGFLNGAHPSLSDVGGFVVASVKWRPFGKFLVDRSQAPALQGEAPPPYAVRGCPDLADSIVKAADATGLWAESTEKWGMDPGHWVPLSHLRPRGDVLAVPVSLSQMSPEAHRKWGVAIRRGTRDWPEPLALLVTGSLSARPDLSGEGKSLEDARRFDEEVLRILTAGPLGALDEMEKGLFKEAQPEGGWGSLYFLWGAVGEAAAGKLEYYDRPLPGVGAAAVLFNL